MQISCSLGILNEPINEIESYIHKIRRLQQILVPIAENDNRPLKEYNVPSNEEPHSSIFHPSIEANNFELKLSLLSMLHHNQFSSALTHDLNLHVSIFVEFCDTIKCNGVYSITI